MPAPRPHVAGVAAMLAGAGLSPAALACGAHEPMDAATARELMRSGASPSPLHHNCSGKHAAMLATAVHLAEPTEGYWRPDHPVQQRIRRALEDMTGCAPRRRTRAASTAARCRTGRFRWPALPRAFARLATGEGLAPERAEPAGASRDACWAHPELVAGPGQLVTLIMQRLPGQVLVKSGAEGVYCGAFPERGPRLRAQDRRRRQARRRGGRGAGDRAGSIPPARASGPDPRTHQLARTAGGRGTRQPRRWRPMLERLR